MLPRVCSLLEKYPGVRSLAESGSSGQASPRHVLRQIANRPLHRAARLPPVTVVSLRLDMFAPVSELMAALRRRMGLPASEVDLYPY